jgi:hypothetical protein
VRRVTSLRVPSDAADERSALAHVLTAGGLMVECLQALEGLDVWVVAGGDELFDVTVDRADAYAVPGGQPGRR